MKVVGEAIVRAPAEAIWSALSNPAVVAKAIPGCERFTVDAGGVAEFLVTTRLTAVSGTFTGRLVVADHEAPRYLTFSASGSGEQGTFTADVIAQLSFADGASSVSYDVNAVVGGAIGAVGSRFLASAARRLATEFFAAIESAIVSQPGPAETDVPPAMDAAQAASTSPDLRPPPIRDAQPAIGAALATAIPATGGAGPAPDGPVTGSVTTPGSWPAPEPRIRGLAGTLTWTGRAERPDPRVAMLAGLVIGLIGVLVGLFLGRTWSGGAVRRSGKP